MKGSIIAININSEDLKLAEISRENGEKKILRLYHHIPDKEGKEATVTEVIRKFTQGDNSRKSQQTILVISSNEINYQDFSFPFDSYKKVTNAIGFEIATKYPPDSYILDHIKSSSKEPGKNSFLAAMADRDMLKRRIKEAEDAGLKIIGVTSDISTLGNFFSHEDEALVMDIGESQTLFALYNKGVPVLARDIPIGVKEISRGAKDEQKLEIRPFISEIKRTIQSFNAKTGLHLEKVHVSGNILARREIFNALKENLELDFISSSRVKTGFIPKQDVTDLNIYASVLGAAEWKRTGLTFNFLKEEFIRSDPGEITRSYIRWGALIAVSFLLAVFISLWLNIFILEERKSFLADEIRKTFVSTFPHVKRIVDEVRDAENILNEGKFESESGTPSSEIFMLDALEKISRSIPRETNFKINNLFWERGKLEINGSTDSFKTVNTIKDLLLSVKDFFAVTISNAKQRTDGQEVEFKITIRLVG